MARLAKHPSLVMWNGGNENIWGYVEWNWRAPLAGRTWGDGYYTELFPAIVAELDPRTPYSPGSPFSYAKYHHPNDHRHGTMHIWDVWNQLDYRHYRDYPARFVSEMGFQGPPAWSTLASVVHDEPMDPHGEQMLVHQKAIDGNLKLARGIGDHLPMWRTEPQVDIDDWHWTTQLNQARAVSYGVAHLRSLYPLNRGTVVWQLNDNWPVISWAAVDGHGIRKPLWYALREVYADRFMTIQPRSDSGEERPMLLLHNDSAAPWRGQVMISRRRTVGDAEPLGQQHVSFELEPRAATAIMIDDDVLSSSSPTEEYLVAEAASASAAYWYFVEDPQLHAGGSVRGSRGHCGADPVRLLGAGLGVVAGQGPDAVPGPPRCRGQRRHRTGDPAGRPEPHLPGDFPANRSGSGGVYAQTGPTQRQRPRRGLRRSAERHITADRCDAGPRTTPRRRVLPRDSNSTTRSARSGRTTRARISRPARPDRPRRRTP